jgi:hypothetical protein
MTLPSYRALHPGATITAAQLATLRAYLDPFGTIAPTLPRVPAGDVAPMPRAEAAMAAPRVMPAPNGLTSSRTTRTGARSAPRIAGTTIRFGRSWEMRLRCVPWLTTRFSPGPEGAAFARVAWQAVPDAQGVLRTGKFVQVEFMVKGKTKYKSTAGWGFGRWLGTELKPYGADARFTGECVGCHTPVRDNDYAYTTPLLRAPPQGEGQ